MKSRPLTDTDIAEILRMRAARMPIFDIAVATNQSRRTISRIVGGSIYRAKTRPNRLGAVLEPKTPTGRPPPPIEPRWRLEYKAYRAPKTGNDRKDRALAKKAQLAKELAALNAELGPLDPKLVSDIRGRKRGIKFFADSLGAGVGR